MHIHLLNDPFIISKEKLFKHNNLNQVFQLSNAYIYTNGADFKKYTYKNYSIYILGYVLDVRDGQSTTEEIGGDLLKAYADGINIFLDNLDYISGRYILLMDDSEDVTIYTDATGLKPMFYWERTIFGSHEILVREVINSNYEANIEKPKRRLNGYLDYSNSSGILKANPNFSYSFNKNKCERIYPRKHFKVKSSDEVLNTVLPALEEEVKWLNKLNIPLYLSLTGGFDSKVTMALTKDIQEKISYFTYMRNTDNSTKTVKWIYKTDKNTVDKLRYNLNLNHRYLHIDEIKIPERRINDLSNHTTSNHSFKLGLVMGEILRNKSLHIKSTLYELGKVPYEIEYDYLNEIEQMYKITNKWRPSGIKEIESKKMFQSYLNRNDLETVTKLNYHLPLIVYWETRMGNWHSNITQETDLNQDTFIIINNRFMLDNFISLSLEDRKDAILFKKLIRIKWPILNYFIPNSNNTLEDKVTLTKNTQDEALNKNGLKFISIKNIDIRIKDFIYYVQPLNNTLLKDDRHELEIRNDSKKDMELNIKSSYGKARNHIFIDVGINKFDITELTQSRQILISPGEKIKVSYRYKSNFNKDSWFEAGALSLYIK